MSESEVRTMLENYRTDSANLEWWFEHKDKETDVEFYEGESLGAVDYNKDRIQSSGEVDGGAVGLICKRARKQYDDELEEFIRGKCEERLKLHHLDCAVADLPSMQQSIIRKRYYEGKTILQVQIEINYSERTIKYIVRRAIRTIAERMLS